MHNFILHSGDNVVYENTSDRHGYKIYIQSPLGKAMMKAKQRGPGTFVLLSDLPNYDPRNGPFAKLRGQLELDQVLNVGKEWSFRSLFSLGNECIGEDSLNTNQAFQTRLRWTGDSFRIHTQVSGCTGGQHKSYMVPHEFCFKEHRAGEMHNTMPKMFKEEAQEKFVDEILNPVVKNQSSMMSNVGYNFC